MCRMGLSVRTRVLFCCCVRSKGSLIVPSSHLSPVALYSRTGGSERENGVYRKTLSTTTSRLSPNHIVPLSEPTRCCSSSSPVELQSLVLQGHPSPAEGDGRRSSRLCEAGLDEGRADLLRQVTKRPSRCSWRKIHRAGPILERRHNGRGSEQRLRTVWPGDGEERHEGRALSVRDGLWEGSMRPCVCGGESGVNECITFALVGFFFSSHCPSVKRHWQPSYNVTPYIEHVTPTHVFKNARSIQTSGKSTRTRVQTSPTPCPAN